MPLTDRFLGRPASVSQAEAEPGLGSGVTIYWRDGCPFCVKMRTAVRKHRDQITWVDIWADPDAAALGLQEFLTTPVDWYARLAIATSRHPRVRLSQINVPTLFVSATYDVLAGARDMASASRRLSDRGVDSEYVELRGSHFIQLEQPDRVHQLLLDFLAGIEGDA